MRRRRGAFDLIEVRDRRYLNWRYCDQRGGDFTIVQAEESGRLAGFAVGTQKRGDGYVADLLALPGRSDVASVLVADLTRRLERRGVHAVQCWLPHHHPYRAILREHGFVTRHGFVAFHYRADTIDPEEVAFLGEPDAKIHVTAGDSDIF